jgi:hypothetical protein
MAAAQQPQGAAGARGVGAGTGTPPSQVAAPQAPADFATIGYSPVYYPGTTLAARATTLTVGAGEERTGVDFALSMVRTAKIEGTVIAPPGVPTQGVQLLLVSSGAAAMAGGDLINSARLGPDGKFTFTNIAPGQYTLTARTGGRSTVMTFGPGGSASSTMAFTTLATPGQPLPGRGGTGASANAGPGADPGPQYWGLVDVTVDGQNLSNVSVSLQPGMTLTGRIAVDALKMAVPADLSRARITLAPVTTGSGMSMAFGGAQVDPSGQFTITGLTPGKYRFTAALASDGALGSWQLKSAVAGGRDALDVPLDLGPGETISNAVVTFTDATQEVSGRLQDASGRPATDFTMVVFPADPRFWLAQSRRIKAVRPATDGRFVVTGLPPGEYRIAATLDVTQNEAADPALLERPERLSFEAWIAHWHGPHREVALETQCTFTYVRNVVVRALTPDAPPWAGIVEEGFPAAAVTDPMRWYKAEGSPETLKRNVARMVESCRKFLDLERVESHPMSEYRLGA